MTPDQAERRLKLLSQARRIVVKIGSGVLTGGGYTTVDDAVIEEIARQVADISKGGRKVAVVTSGAVAIGAKMLNVPRHGLSIPVKQAAAALGQGSLIALWARHLAAHGVKAGQALLTHDDLSDRKRFINSRNTMNAMFDLGVVPVINENDTVAVDEIKFGDNDTLSARVTNLVEADLLAVLSDVDGLYQADPRKDKNAARIDFVEEVDESILSVAGDSSSRTGLGGMASKVRAAAEAARFGTPTIILPGTVTGSLLAALAGKPVGTFFSPHEDRLDSKRHWIEFTLKSSGEIHVDAGAKEAILKKGRSLLASGITKVAGDFDAGEAVNIFGPDGEKFAKGLVNYPSREIERIKGARSNQIENLLGYKAYDEIIHRDDMAFCG
ncbi:MAG: glutamate 5-kinase [Nitrospinae bacterium]|nr:glutamate 5-kinase [Nitrospinota bacterium]